MDDGEGYTCRQCGGDKVIKYERSNANVLMLECPDCGERDHFAATSQETFWKVSGFEEPMMEARDG